MLLTTEPLLHSWLVLLLPIGAVGVLLLWAALLRRRGRFAGGPGRLHGLGRYFEAPRTRELALDFSALGSSTVVTLFTACFAGLFWLAGQAQAAWTLIGVSIFGGACGNLLKRLTRRSRPGQAGAVHFGSSFPSAHTVMGSTLYGSTAVLILPLLPSAVAPAVYGLAVLLALLIGASRVVLRVHYLSDVVAGWALAGSLVTAVHFWR